MVSTLRLPDESIAWPRTFTPNQGDHGSVTSPVKQFMRTAAVDRARLTQTAVANALNAAAERIEKTTQVLNRTIGGGIAIG